MNRTVNYWRDLLQPGYHGNPPIASFPSHFSIQNPLHRSRPLHIGLKRTRSLLKIVRLHHLVRSSLLLWVMAWPSGPSGFHSFRKSIPTYPLTLSTVHTRFQNMNNSVTRFATFFRGMHNRQSHSYCPPCSSYLTTYIGFKRLKPIEHRRQNRLRRAIQRIQSVKPTILESQKPLSESMRPLPKGMQLPMGIMQLEKAQAMRLRMGRGNRDQMAWVVGGKH